MATTKYFVLPSSTGANFTDFNLSYGSVTLNGEQVAFVGSSAVDAVFVRPGVTVDFTLSGSGADKIYLGGNFASYTASIAGSVMTLQRGSAATLESVSFIKSTSALSSDGIIFADGTLNSLDLYNNLKTATALPALSTAETSIAPLAPALAGSVLNASIKAFALNSTGDTFAPARPGVAMTVVGSLGVDTVYVPRGGAVDCTLLGSGQDLIYFTGNWADYSKAISGSVLTFSRTVDGYNESVKVVGSATNISLNDRLVFADGAVYSGNAKTALSASLTTAVNAVTGYDATLVTPLSRDTVAPTLVISDDGGSASGVYNYSFTFSEAVTGFAASDIAVVNGSTGAFTTIDASHYNLLVTPTSSATPLDLTVNVGAGAATDLAGNANTAAVQVLHSVLYGSPGADTLTVGAALDAVFLGAGADVLKVTQAGNATTALTDRVFDFSVTDTLDLTGLLGSGGSGYASVLQDSGAGFVELKNLSLLKDVANNQTNVSFDISFDAATIGGSKISAAVIDLFYQHASVVGGVAISPTFTSGAGGAVWQVIQTNLSPADSSNPNGKIALLATQDAANPIITTGNAATGSVLTVNLILNGLTNTFAVGLESQAGGGGTSVMTANGQAYGVETGITKIAGAAAGGTGVLEIVTDTGVLGTVGDNQLHMLTRFDAANNLTHLQLAYDTNPGAGATTASNVIAMDFLGDVTANLIPSHINYL